MPRSHTTVRKILINSANRARVDLVQDVADGKLSSTEHVLAVDAMNTLFNNERILTRFVDALRHEWHRK